MTTIETIAKKAGVSRGTVDRVLHHRGRVKEKTAQRVWAVMEELNFQPNSLGRALYLSREKNKIGVLVSFREQDFQRQVMLGVEEAVGYARQHGIETVTEFAEPAMVPYFRASRTPVKPLPRFAFLHNRTVCFCGEC